MTKATLWPRILDRSQRSRISLLLEFIFTSFRELKFGYPLIRFCSSDFTAMIVLLHFRGVGERHTP